MGQMNPCFITRCLVQIQNYLFTDIDWHSFFSEVSQAQFGPLKIGQDSNRAVLFFFYRAYGFYQLFERVMRGVAHVDAEHIRTTLEELFDFFR